MPKNKGKNAFFFFMIDYKKREEARGAKFPQGLRSVQEDPKCTEEWKSLTKAMKAPYEALAKESKFAAAAQGKKTNTGELLEDVEREKKEEQLFAEAMYEYIRSTISLGVRNENLNKLKFCFIHVNHFFIKTLDKGKEDYFPAEYAVGIYCLENGMEDMRHKIITAQIPFGFTREALETSACTHKIPINTPLEKEGESDFSIIYDELIDFVKPITGTSSIRLFTSDAVKPKVQCFVRKIAEAKGEDDKAFLIYSLESLFHELRDFAVKQQDYDSIPLVVAAQQFAKDPYSYTTGFECIFHKTVDSGCKYCSMSTVKRWGFTISEHCCPYLEIPLVPGVHYPISQQNGAEDEIESVAQRMRLLNVESNPKILSMTGVSEEHRVKRSARTYAEEQRRRLESEPVQVIKHNNNDSVSSLDAAPPVPTRPLRLPNSQSTAMMDAKGNPLSVNEMNFPPIGGRGVPRKKTAYTKVTPGYGRGSG